jgi:hypothetical protein
MKKQQTLSRRIRAAPRCQWFNLDWILTFFASLDDQITRISRMKASIFFVIRARSGPRVLLQANSAKERDDQASEGIIIVTRSTRCSYPTPFWSAMRLILAPFG